MPITPQQQEFDELFAKRFKLWRALINMSDFARGTVVVLRRPCTYKNCQPCRKGDKHPAVYLSISKKGKTHLIYLPKAVVQKAREWIGNYQKLQQVVEEVSDTNHKILRILAKESKLAKTGAANAPKQ